MIILKKEQHFYVGANYMIIFCDIMSNASWEINNVEHKKNDTINM